MKKAIFLLIILIAVLLFNNISTFALDPIKTAANNVNKFRNLTVKKASKQIDLKWAPATNPSAAESVKFCRSATNFPLTQGSLTCHPNHRYTIKAKNNKYEFGYYEPDKLFLVSLVSSQSFPSVYYNYSYPDGKLKGVIVALSAKDKMVFNPDGKLRLYLTDKGCFQDNSNNELVMLRYTQQLCETYYTQEANVVGISK